MRSELARSEADLASVRNDLEKLALAGKKITYKDLEGESLSIEDPKAYRYASALVEGHVGEALGIAHEFFANDPRGAAIPLHEPSGVSASCGQSRGGSANGALASRTSGRFTASNRLSPARPGTTLTITARWLNASPRNSPA